MYGFEAMIFNIHGGYLEAIVRGHRSPLITTTFASARPSTISRCTSLPPSTAPTSKTVELGLKFRGCADFQISSGGCRREEDKELVRVEEREGAHP
ncbi:hypothetical protein ACFX13_007956 [Malus domestica]